MAYGVTWNPVLTIPVAQSPQGCQSMCIRPMLKVIIEFLRIYEKTTGRHIHAPRNLKFQRGKVLQYWRIYLKQIRIPDKYT